MKHKLALLLTAIAVLSSIGYYGVTNSSGKSFLEKFKPFKNTSSKNSSSEVVIDYYDGEYDGELLSWYDDGEYDGEYIIEYIFEEILEVDGEYDGEILL